MSSISVVFVVKNAIKQGYCFIDSLRSCLPIADELIISEGFSEDDTLNHLCKFRTGNRRNTKIVLDQDQWPESSYHGEAITEISTRAMQRATREWIYYLQADEIIHEDTVPHIKAIAKSSEFNSASFPFHHFINKWEPAVDDKYYKEAIRMIRRGRDISLMGDAWNFQGEVDPICPAGHSPKPIYHFAWVFPPQNDIKNIEHAKIYKNIPEYQEKMQKACEVLDQPKQPYPRTDFDEFPRIPRRFVGKVKYEP